MKNIMLFILALSLLGCEKTEKLTPSVRYDRFYFIVDDTTDAVQHRRFELYEKYGVPVYFNDTIGRIYIKTDVYGDSVFKYETLDMAWGFTSYEKTTYRYVYMTDSIKQMQALDIAESFLEAAGTPLYPFNIFVVTSAEKVDERDASTPYKEGEFIIGYRTLLLTGNWPKNKIPTMPKLLMKGLLKTKIANFPDQLEVFNKVSEKAWYGGIGWTVLTKDAPDGFYTSPIREGWWGEKKHTPEQLLYIRDSIRRIIGPFGFVDGDSKSGGYMTPNNATEDMEAYITEMLRFPPAEFKKLWAMAPLVIIKYDILYDIISNKLGVQL
ncbi:MAG: hypothetical protein RR137_05260 [Odoribacter sp.]